MTFIEAADRIGARLCRDGLWSEGRCTWISPQIVSVDKLATRALGSDLYDGTAGVALFLNALASATGDSIFRQTADAALTHALKEAGGIPAYWRPGFYSGWGGIAWVLTQFGREAEAAKWARAIKVTPELDLMCGCSGAIAPLLRLGLAELAIPFGEELLARAVNGAWPTLIASARPGRPHLTGFAHGAAGIAWSLLELYAATGEDRYRAGAEAGFAYENSCFSRERGNWPDYRSDPPSYPIAWCHGAVGIGLSRARASEILNNPEYRNEAVMARSRSSAGVAGNFSLCHGQSANAEFCDAPEVIEGAIAEYEAKHMLWPCGTRGAAEVPGLMLGIAGIGYTCLRFAYPDRFDSVLLPSTSQPHAHSRG